MIKRVHSVAILAMAALCAAGPATPANIGFQPKEQPAVVVAGEGGIKLSNRGVDIWIVGDPAGKYRQIGVLTDTRWGLLAGDALTSRALARRIKQIGGDAAFVLEGGGRNDWGFYSDRARFLSKETITRVMVVKYVRSEPTDNLLSHSRSKLYRPQHP